MGIHLAVSLRLWGPALSLFLLFHIPALTGSEAQKYRLATSYSYNKNFDIGHTPFHYSELFGSARVNWIQTLTPNQILIGDKHSYTLFCFAHTARLSLSTEMANKGQGPAENYHNHVHALFAISVCELVELHIPK